MLEFKPIELSDKPKIDECMWAENSRSADFNFANIFMWDKTFKQSVAYIGQRYVIKTEYSHAPFFAFPTGSGNLKPVVEQLREYSGRKGFPLCIRGVTENNLKALNELFPGEFQCTDDRAFFDYIYSAEKLASLAGKKLHSKRNHINRFEEANDWNFEPLTVELVPACMVMLEQWESLHTDPHDHNLISEHAAISRAFQHYVYLGLEGGILRSAGKIIGFTVGERISSDTYNIHFEKAYSDIHGAYPMINREFVRHILSIHPEIEYINREDDMGKDNLRKAKLSYYPEYLLEKHTAIWS